MLRTLNFTKILLNKFENKSNEVKSYSCGDCDEGSSDEVTVSINISKVSNRNLIINIEI